MIFFTSYLMFHPKFLSMEELYLKDVRLPCQMVTYLRQFLIRGMSKGGDGNLNRELRR